MSDIVNLTQQIIAYSEGEKIKLGAIVDALYGQLCEMANYQLNKLNPEAITPQELVHEVYIRFSKTMVVSAEGRKHFLAIAATAMRQLIIDQLKGKSRVKRGGHLRATTLSGVSIPTDENLLEIIAVNKAIVKLKEIEPKLASTVECRYFAGYSELETAQALDVSVRTVRRYWKRAKKWLVLELNEGLK